MNGCIIFAFFTSLLLTFHGSISAKSPIIESDCSNGVDDNNDGLFDTADPHCYFYSDSIHHDCPPTPIIWIGSPDAISWVNLQTHEEHVVAPLNLELLDIAWSASGLLYGVSRAGEIYQFDPITWAPVLFATITGYSINGMTIDNNGVFYLSGFVDLQNAVVISFNPQDGQTELIVRLSDYGLSPSGDCCFLNGSLYVSCDGYIAKVDIKNRTVEPLRLPDFPSSFGIAAIGDGYLYITDNTTGIYRLDIANMEVALQQSFSDPLMVVFGFASYTDPCHSKCPSPLVRLGNDTLMCTQTSITLRNAIAGSQYDRFLWSDQSTQSTLTVSVPGTYWLKVSSVCGSTTDTIVIAPKIDSCECFLYLPNAFSPNNDRVNDQFQLSSNCPFNGTIFIYNRWGQQVYSSDRLDRAWNGMLHNQPQPSGLYIYQIRFQYYDRPGTFTRKGIVTLVR